MDHFRAHKAPNAAYQVLPFHTIYTKCSKCDKKGYSKISRSLKNITKVKMAVLFLTCLPCFIRYIDRDDSFKSSHSCVFCGHYYGKTGENVMLE